jgi:hypothetical protein
MSPARSSSSSWREEAHRWSEEVDSVTLRRALVDEVTGERRQATLASGWERPRVYQSRAQPSGYAAGLRYVPRWKEGVDGERVDAGGEYEEYQQLTAARVAELSSEAHEVFGERDQALEQAMFRARQRRNGEKNATKKRAQATLASGGGGGSERAMAAEDVVAPFQELLAAGFGGAPARDAVLRTAPLLSNTRPAGTLTVRVVNCRELLAADSGARFSDPYVSLSVSGARDAGGSVIRPRKTKQMPRQLSPAFNEAFEFELPAPIVRMNSAPWTQPASRAATPPPVRCVCGRRLHTVPPPARS